MKTLYVRLIGVTICCLLFFPARNQAQTQPPAANDYLVTVTEKLAKLNTKADTIQAFTTITAAEVWLKKNNAYKEALATTLYNLAGNLYERSGDPTKAHQYYTLALNNARKYKHEYEKAQALHALIMLHESISVKDLKFKYPQIAETEEEGVYFPIEKINADGDSLLLTILAGKNDGVVMGLLPAEIFTSIKKKKDSVNHSDINFYGKARIVSIGDNKTILKVLKGKRTLFEGDLASIKVNVPVSWRKLFLREFITQNVYFTNNYQEKLLHYRYFYYYQDEFLEAEISEQMKTAVDEIAQMLSNPEGLKKYPQKAETGVFAGIAMIDALKQTKPSDILLFLSFVKQFPGSYVANNFRFSETYATWIIYNTILNPKDIGPYLLSLATSAVRQKKALNFKNQLLSEQMIDRWLDEGMQQVDVENITAARQSVLLLNDCTQGIGDNFNSGWGDYLSANIEKKLTNDSLALKFLAQAEQKFSANGNKEGLSWVKTTGDLWKKTNQVKVGVQIGHFFSYIIARSPNPRYYATGSSDALIKIWDSRLGKEINTITTHSSTINSLAYSKNGRYLLSTSEDSTTCIFNAYNYGLLHTYKNKSPQKVARFSPDNKYIVSGGADSVVRFINIQTGEIEKVLKLHKGKITGIAFHPLNKNILYTSSTDSMVYCWDVEKEKMVSWYKHGGKALSVKLSNNGKYMSVVSTDTVLNVWNLETAKSRRQHINMHRLANTNYFGEEAFSPDSKYIAYPDTKNTFAVLDVRDFAGIQYGTQASGNDLEEISFSDDGLSMYARFFSYGQLRTYNFAGYDLNDNANLRFKDQRQYSNVVFGAQFTADDNNVVVIENHIASIDLRTGVKTIIGDGSMPVVNRHVMLKDENLISYFDPIKQGLIVFDHKRKVIVKKFPFSADEKISAITWSPDSRYCFLSGVNGTINGFDITQNKQLFAENINHKNEITSLEYDAFAERLFAVGDNMIWVIDPLSGNIRDSIGIRSPNLICAAQKYIFSTSTDGLLYKYDALTLKLLNKTKLNDKGLPAYQLVLTPDQKFLVIINEPKSLMLFDIEKDRSVYIIPDQDQETLILTINHSGDTFATGSLNSALYLYETATGNRKAAIFMPLDKDIMITDKEQHYMASKNTLDAIQFTYNNNAYSFDQFDVQLNRPDLVLKAIGRADSAIIKSYYNAYLKRIKRLKLNESTAGVDVHLPRVQLENKFAVPPVTLLNEYEITVSCSDTRYNLQTLQVLVNNVPLLGLNGMDLSKLNTRQLTQKIKIPLAVDNNNIKVFCTNSMGAASLKESFDVISKYKTTQPPKLYFIGIGVANYKDKSMNLKYSVKDIRDLAKTFKKLNPSASIDTLINGRVTKENIIALKQKLMQTSINDKVILAVTGHGLLSSELDFYFGTWDVDFKKPELRGLKYEALEDLLSGIPARQKLMLIDACHSGALDKEELTAIKTNNLQQTLPGASGNIKQFAARGIELENAGQKISANSSFDLMQSLFTDLSAGNGAVIISAAGGMEFAFESPKWNNGVFTYCVRKGIEDLQADEDGGNNDGNVSVQELLNYVGRKVEELTGGRQKPTSRRDNIDYEWRVR